MQAQATRPVCKYLSSYDTEDIALGEEEPEEGACIVSGPGITEPVIYKRYAHATSILAAHPPSCAVAKFGSSTRHIRREPVPGGCRYRLLLPSGAPTHFLHTVCTLWCAPAAAAVPPVSRLVVIAGT